MNLQCPNCQKLLQVPEQYAGQLMKCPLCGGTFTLPALPAPAPEPTYALAESPAASEPPAPLAPPADSLTGTGPTSAPASGLPPAREPELFGGAAPPDGPPSTGYTHHYAIWFNPDVLRYVAPVSVVLIFILQFFPWVGVYPGGVPVITQGAWGAGFGSYSVDHDLEAGDVFTDAKEQPGASVLTIFYLLLFVLVALPVTIAVLVPLYVPVRLPPGLQAIWPWRWAIVSAVNALAFLFLFLQLLVGFSLETALEQKANRVANAPKDQTTKGQKEAELGRGIIVAQLHRTGWLWLAVLLHLLAIVSAALVYCLDKRGDRPLPRLELFW